MLWWTIILFCILIEKYSVLFSQKHVITVEQRLDLSTDKINNGDVLRRLGSDERIWPKPLVFIKYKPLFV